MKPNNEPAFPAKSQFNYYLGMTLRDYFANGTLMGYWCDPNLNMPLDEIAKRCYEMADAMMEERNK